MAAIHDPGVSLPAARRGQRARAAAAAACLVTLLATLLATVAAGTAEASTGSPSAAPSAGSGAGSTPSADVVGGAQLGSHGLVVDPLPGAPALPHDITASGWLVADLDTGAVLAARDPHGHYLPASTLKTLTAVTLLPALDPAAKVLATNDDAGVDGTKVGLVPGFGYTVRDLFTAMLVMSANDAALGLADAYGGLPRTLRAMNAEARHLQADDTVAKTPNGLDAPGQHTSAYDLALIARAGLAMPEFRHYIGIISANFPAPKHKHYQIYTHDSLLLHYRGAIGVKDGYTIAAHASYVGAATRRGHTLVVTLLHADPYCWHEAARLLDWGFRAENLVQPVGTLVGPVQPSGDAAAADAAAGTVHDVPPGSRPVAATSRGTGLTDHAIPLGAAIGVGIAVLALGQSRLRRRRRYGRSRLSLPKL